MPFVVYEIIKGFVYSRSSTNVVHHFFFLFHVLHSLWSAATITGKLKLKTFSILCLTQGNYATRDSNGMCHLMPQRHLPGWIEEEEWAFVHHGSWIPNKGLDNILPATANCIYKKSLKSDGWHFGKLCFKLRCNSMVWTWTATVMSAHSPLSTLTDAAVASSGACHCYPEWHSFPVNLTKSQIPSIPNELYS